MEASFLGTHQHKPCNSQQEKKYLAGEGGSCTKPVLRRYTCGCSTSVLNLELQRGLDDACFTGWKLHLLLCESTKGEIRHIPAFCAVYARSACGPVFFLVCQSDDEISWVGVGREEV